VKKFGKVFCSSVGGKKYRERLNWRKGRDGRKKMGKRRKEMGEERAEG